jgi:Arc/MetJ-type ribon-helix-helix transcriptional regulator
MGKGRTMSFTLARKLDEILNQLVREGIYIKKADILNACVLEFCARRNLIGDQGTEENET